jgi:hypothetical protein
LHDICKFDTVRENPKTGFPTSPGHDKAAEELILSNNTILSWIHHYSGSALRISAICGAHMRFHFLGNMRPAKHDAQVQKWKDQGIFDLLQIFGAADNMLVEFDLNNLEQSWKFNENKEEIDDSHLLDQVMNLDLENITKDKKKL